MIKKIVNRMQKYYGQHKALLRFMIVGCLNTGLDFLAFFIAWNYGGVNYYGSQLIGYSAGIVNSFLFNKSWTFESKRFNRQTLGQLLRFLIINGVSLGSSVVLLGFLTEKWQWAILIAKILVTIITQVINYAGYRCWVFAVKKRL